MPQFGEYETVEQISIVEESRHVTTVWKARKTGPPDGRLYFVKCYSPRRDRITSGQPDEMLQRDRALNFLEGIKQLKKTQHEGGGVAAVHALGLTPEGAWFVTDYYGRGTLKDYIDRKGDVDSAALRHVVYSVVAGCLALKRSRGGKSHGNLKPSNVLLAGKPCPLKKTPLHLTDPHPAPLQLAKLDTDDRQTGGELLDKTLELQDLRAVGELILQLVESRLLPNADGYNWPVPGSVKWDSLGKAGETWRGLCNRLLDPKFSVEQKSLENLEREFRPSALTKKVPMILAWSGAVILLGIASYVGVAAFGRALKGSRAGHEEAEQRPSNTQTRSHDAPEEARREANFRTATNAAWLAWQRRDYLAVTNQAGIALGLKPGDRVASDLMVQGQEGIKAGLAVAAVEQEYRAATNAAWAALERRDHPAVTNEAGIALRLKPGDRVASDLMVQGQEGIKAGLAVAAVEQEYRAATNAAWAALERRDYPAVTNQAGMAFRLKPGDSVASDLMVQGQEGIKAGVAAAALEQEYRAATNAAWAALERRDYPAVTNQAGMAFRLKPGDSVASDLMVQGQEGIKAGVAAAALEQEYRAATNAAWAALERKDYPAVTNQAGLALKSKPGDPMANNLMAQGLEKIRRAGAAGNLLARDQEGNKAPMPSQGYEPDQFKSIQLLSELIGKKVYPKDSSGFFGSVGKLEDVALDFSTGRLVLGLVSSGSDRLATPVPSATFTTASKLQNRIDVDKKVFADEKAPRVARANWPRGIERSNLDQVFRHFKQDVSKAGVEPAVLSSGMNSKGMSLVDREGKPLGELEDLVVDFPKGQVALLVIKPVVGPDPQRYLYVLPPFSVRFDTNGQSLGFKGSLEVFLKGDMGRVEKAYPVALTDPRGASSVYRYYHQALAEPTQPTKSR